MIRLIWVLALAFASSVFGQALHPTPPAAPAALPTPVIKPKRPIPEIEHVLLISIDGLRPDRALLADMPNLRRLINGGTYTFWAKTTAVSITLPSHTSMLTAVSPRKHGIEWNSDLPFSKPVYPKVPTVFQMCTEAGLSSAMIVGKTKFDALDVPGTITYSSVPTSGQGTNPDVTLRASAIIKEHRPDFIFVHYPDVDATGHGYGWGSPQQFAAIEATDIELGKLFACLEEAGIATSTAIIVSADHGGAGRTHGPDDPRSRHIPWILSGPRVRPHFDLTQIESLEVRTEDSAATTCFLLGLPQKPYFDGHPVLAAFLEKP